MSGPDQWGDAGELVGTVLAGRYEVTGVLGRGGMGVVLEARQIAVDRKVAVKLLHAAYATNRHAVARFVREMKVTSRLEHPATVRVYDFGEAEVGGAVHLFLVMELVQGRTLGQALAEGELSLARVLAIAEQIARALEAAHGEAIVHRDLKPDNAMLVDRYELADQVKVLDFGIARFVEGAEEAPAAMRLTAEGAVVGTPTYMSPEQATGGEIGPKSDLYSLGVMLFELATGTVPFTAPTTVSLMVKHVQEPPPRPSELAPVPPRLEALILACLEKDPARRPESARQVADELAAIAREVLADERDAVGPARVVRGEGPRFEALKRTALAAETARGVGEGASGEDAASERRARGRTWPWLAGGGIAAAVAVAVAIAVTGGGTSEGAEPPTLEAARSLSDVDGEDAVAGEVGDADAAAGGVGDAADAGGALAGGAPTADVSAAVSGALKRAERADAEAEVDRGRKAQNRQDWDAARQAYTRAIAIAPEWGLPRLNLALVELAQGRPEAARVEVDRLLEVDAGWPDARLVRAQIGLALKDFEGARKDAEAATVATPERAEAWFVLGESHRAIAGEGGAIGDEGRRAYCRAKGLGMMAAARWCDPGE